MGKRFISSLLAVTMAASLAAGCGSASSDGNGTDTAGSGTDTASAGTEASTGASQVVLIHGNNMSRQIFYNQICQVKAEAGNKPVLCNEDSQALSNMQVALDNGVSWGYYNNMTKQEPPVVWGIKNDEDRFFAMRMAQSLGISSCDLPVQSCFEIAGLDDELWEGKRWLRLACLYPEMVDSVAWYRNDTFLAMAYDDPFSVNYLFNWLQMPVEGIQTGETVKAVIRLAGGQTIVKEKIAR